MRQQKRTAQGVHTLLSPKLQIAMHQRVEGKLVEFGTQIPKFEWDSSVT